MQSYFAELPEEYRRVAAGNMTTVDLRGTRLRLEANENKPFGAGVVVNVTLIAQGENDTPLPSAPSDVQSTIAELFAQRVFRPVRQSAEGYASSVSEVDRATTSGRGS